MTCEPTLSERQARLVRELARTPGKPVHWTILADAMGVAELPWARQRVQQTAKRVREKFGADIIGSAGTGRQRRGYYLPADWDRR